MVFVFLKNSRFVDYETLQLQYIRNPTLAYDIYTGEKL